MNDDRHYSDYRPQPNVAPAALPGFGLDLDPGVVLRKLKIADAAMDEFLAVLPDRRTDLGGRRLRLYFATPAEIQRLAGFPMRRF